MPAHLAATSEDDRRRHERQGFAVFDELAAPGGPPLWAVWRAPRRIQVDRGAAPAGADPVLQ